MTKQIKSFKLITAEEVIANSEEKDDHFLLTDARVCVVTGCNPKTNEISSALLPFMNTGGSAPIKLYKTSIVGEVPTDPGVERSFLSQTSQIELL